MKLDRYTWEHVQGTSRCEIFDNRREGSTIPIAIARNSDIAALICTALNGAGSSLHTAFFGAEG